MKTIDVCLSPDLMHLYDVRDKTVVIIDILRATSCMTTAFAHGIESITPFAKLEDCIAMKAKGYFTAGERDGKKVDGFDLGNSPFEYMEEKLKGRKIGSLRKEKLQQELPSFTCFGICAFHSPLAYSSHHHLHHHLHHQ